MAKPQHRLVHPVSPKSYANAAVARAVRAGSLVIPLACEACGQPGTRGGKITRQSILAHHWSYAPEHWLDVIPLCVQCHGWVHYGTIPEPRTGRVYESPLIHRRPRDLSGSVVVRSKQRGRGLADLTPAEVAEIAALRGVDARLPCAVASALGVAVPAVRAIWLAHLQPAAGT